MGIQWKGKFALKAYFWESFLKGDHPHTDGREQIMRQNIIKVEQWDNPIKLRMGKIQKLFYKTPIFKKLKNVWFLMFLL